MRNIDQRLFALFGGTRPPLAEGFIWIFACMAERPVLLAWMLLVLLWLVLKNRDFSATILLAGMAGSELLGLLLGRLLYRPPFLLPLPGSGEIPTGTAIDPLLPALTLCGLVLYFFLGTTKDWRARLRWIMAGSFVALLIGFSRIYLGFSFFSSSLAEFAMAAAWLSFLITAAEVRRRFAGEFPWRPGWQPLHFSRSTRRFILALALVMTLWWVGAYTLQRLPKELNPSIACISQEILLTSSAGKII
jgi:undecaprenyl-diphosphatase